MKNYFLIIIGLVILMVAFLYSQKPLESPELSNTGLPKFSNSPLPQNYVRNYVRDYFYEVHLEPGLANAEMFEVLKKFVNLADEHNIKLTLLFTPQWANMIIADSEKMKILNEWKKKGHEIGGHHHGPNVWPWDGYSDLSVEEINNLRNSRPRISDVEREKVLAVEKFIGNMNDFTELLNKLAGEKIKVLTSSTENLEWPEGVLYAAGGSRLEESISVPKKVIFAGKDVIKITSATLLPKPSVRTGLLITVIQLEKEFASTKTGIFGVISHEIDYKENPKIYEDWFAFLNSIDSSGEHSKTISEIIESYPH